MNDTASITTWVQVNAVRFMSHAADSPTFAGMLKIKQMKLASFLQCEI